MKKTLLLITFALSLSYSALAAPCMTDTLADYISAGSCSIGTDLTFSDFGYIPSGDVIINASAVTVTPDVVGGEAGFVFSAPWGVINGDTLDSQITYTATCD